MDCNNLNALIFKNNKKYFIFFVPSIVIESFVSPGMRWMTRKGQYNAIDILVTVCLRNVSKRGTKCLSHRAVCQSLDFVTGNLTIFAFFFSLLVFSAKIVPMCYVYQHVLNSWCGKTSRRFRYLGD